MITATRTLTLIIAVISVIAGVFPQNKLLAWGKMASLPSNKERFLSCPLQAKPATGELAGSIGPWRTYHDLDFSKPNWWLPFDDDLKSLEKVFPPSHYLVSAIDIRNIDGHYGFRYLGNGGAHTKVLPWSSSKWMAALDTMVKLHEFGLGAHSSLGPYHLGDLITTSHTGFATPTVTLLKSNEIGTLFQNFGGRQVSDHLVKTWLMRPEESFASGYGSKVPLPQSLPCRDLITGKTAQINLSTKGAGRSRISTLSFAEGLKRIATHEDPWNQVRFPGIVADDLRMLFYGHPDRDLGGMLGAYEEAIRKALGGKNQLDQQTAGLWRIFSKTGSASWDTGQEQLINAIICLPGFDGGRLITVSFYVRGAVRKEGLKRLQSGIKQLMAVMVPGFVAPSAPP